MKTTKSSRILSLLLVLCMVFTLVPGMSMTTHAIQYQNPEITAVTREQGVITSLTVTFEVEDNSGSPMALCAGGNAAPTKASDSAEFTAAYPGVTVCDTFTVVTNGFEEHSCTLTGDFTGMTKLYMYCRYNGVWTQDTTSFPLNIAEEVALFDGKEFLKTVANAAEGATIDLPGDIILAQTMNLNKK